ncbi:hypothetical protein NQ317_000230 [Molorchus minor]|uniref:THAP-type domain-containing protein n=1 Tax=Molorchus minor TaxID=1323400 RepID=A0ABQ9JSW4_9CUCU|nr:hypothetical protein NQ317_000230 [Molorchus minor]
MPGSRCAVILCNNNYEDIKKNGLNISFHAFPRNEETRNKWIKACRRGDKWNPKTSVICSMHFDNDDFDKDLKALLNIKTRRRLKPFAVPTKLL